MNPLLELARLFLKLGVIGFGGPAAHIAMMEDEVVTRRKWMSRQHFLDLIGATNLIPGPNSTEMTMHVGYQRAGFVGLVEAGVCFILPAALSTGLLAWAYVRYGQVPQIEPFLYGIKPAVLIVILAAIRKLAGKAMKGWRLNVIGVLVIVLALGGMNEVLAILLGGIVGMLWLRSTGGDPGTKQGFLPPPLPGAAEGAGIAAGAAATGFAAVSLGQLFLVFLKIGAVLFGSGYVLIAFMEGELVQGLGWLTQTQLLDAIAIGQFTPGPVLSTATFVGYQIAGVSGAVVATLGIFLPSFLFVALLNPLVPRLRQSPWSAAFLDSVNVAALGLMAAVTLELGVSTLVDWRAIAVAVVALAAVLFRPGLSAPWLVVGGAILGYLLHLVG